MTVATLTMTPRAAREHFAFRALLAGMARPGTVHRAMPDKPGGTAVAATALLESLLDHEVSFSVVPHSAEMVETLLRLTGAHLEAPARADYILALEGGLADALEQAHSGDPEYPDRGATVVAAVGSVAGEPGRGEEFVLRGPGVNGALSVWVEGFGAADRERLADRNSELPLGIDLVCVAPDGSFICLPRYTSISEGR